MRINRKYTSQLVFIGFYYIYYLSEIVARQYSTFNELVF